MAWIKGTAHKDNLVGTHSNGIIDGHDGGDNTLGSSEKTSGMMIFVWLWAAVILYFAMQGALN